MRVLIVDDHEVVRRGVRSLLDPHCDVCGEAVDGRDAVEKARELKPDVIVMDLSMPNLNGLEATPLIRGVLPHCEVLILSQHNSPEMVRQAFKAGARGYVVKASIGRDLLAALEKVSRHESFFDPTIPGVAHRPGQLDAQEVLQRSLALEKALRETEELYRSTLELAAVGVAHVSPEGRWLRVNKKLCEIVGYSEAELLNLTFQDIAHPDDLAADLAEVERMKAGASDRYSVERRYVRKDRSTIWVSLTVSGVRDTSGRLKHFISVVEDITDRKRMEEERREQEEHTRFSLEAANVGTWDWEVSTGRVRWSRNMESVHGQAPGSFGESFDSFLQGVFVEDREHVMEQINLALSGKGKYNVEYRQHRSDGSLGWMEAQGRVVFDADGKPVKLFGICANITERRNAQNATALLASIVASSDDAVISKTLGGMITSWNRSAERLFGYPSLEAIGQHITLIVPPDRRSEETDILLRLSRGEKIDHFETQRQRKDGSLVEVSITVSPVKDSEGRIIGASNVAQEIAERKRAEQALMEQARLLDLSNDAIFVRDSADKVTYWNKAACELYGYTREEALGNVTHELLHTQFPAPLESVNEQLHRHGRWTGELVHKTKLGTEIVVISRWALDRNAYGRPWSILETNNDITQQKLTEKALRESEKRFRAIIETTPECVKLVDRDGTLLHINSPGLKMVGADCAEAVVGKNVYDLIAPEDRNKFQAFNERICRGEKGSLEFDIVGLEGIRRHMETHAAPLRNPDGSVVQLGVTRDISERKLAHDALLQSEQRLRKLSEKLDAEVRARTKELEDRNADVLRQSEQVRDLSWRLLHTQDEERRHIARELHDSAGQLVAALQMNLVPLESEAQKVSPKLADSIKQTLDLVGQLSKELRTVSYLLHPPLLDEAGLASAIRWYVEGFSERSHIDVRVELSPDLGRLSREMEITIFRIIQECLTNIHRHANCERANIRVSRSAELVRLEVQDDGKGTKGSNNGRNESKPLREGVGIQGMRQRVKQLRGNFEIQLTENGTLVTALFPLHVPKQNDSRTIPDSSSARALYDQMPSHSAPSGTD